MMRPAMATRAVFGAVVCSQLIFPSNGAFAATVVGPGSYLSVIAHAQPGAVIKLRPGVYTEGLSIRELNGTADKPIVIEAADRLQPPRFFARPDKNTVSIVN